MKHRKRSSAKPLPSSTQLGARRIRRSGASVAVNLRTLRKMCGKTQFEVARLLGVDQPELSRRERRTDHLLSTLRNYVEALGGELEVRARFGDKIVHLEGV